VRVNDKEENLRRILALTALVLGVLAMGAAPAGAITGNFQDDNVHTYVGLIAFYDANDEFTHRCSGSLVTPSVFLTAGHCTDATTGATHARLWFQQDAGVGFDAATGSPAPSGYPVSSGVTSSHLFNFGYPAGFPNTKDVGLVVLDKPVTQTNQASLVKSYAALATVRALDRFAKRRGQQDTTFTVSGYGLTRNSPVDSKVISFRKRLMASEKLVNLNSNLTGGFNVQTSANPGNFRGGTCSGDSGGPLLYSTTDIITAVNSFGLNEWCRGVDFMYRVDQAAVQSWIRATVGEAQWSLIRFADL
jgi:hypothetical protein